MDYQKLLEAARPKGTHDCPSCGQGSYCAMEDGKSFGLCWCMTTRKGSMPLPDADRCVCKKCLTADE